MYERAKNQTGQLKDAIKESNRMVKKLRRHGLQEGLLKGK
jgi:hypothetical protein